MGRLSNYFGELDKGYSSMSRNADGTWNTTFNPNYTWDSTKGFVANSGANGGGFFSGLNFGNILSAGTGILQGIAGLRQAQMAEQQLKLAKQQFGFQKGLANRNLANQAKLINNQYDSAAQVAAGMMGGVDAEGNYGMVNPEIVSRYSQAAKEKHVDGSAID